MKWLNGELSDLELEESIGTDEFAKTKRLSEAVQAYKASDFKVDEEYLKLKNKLHASKKKASLYQKISPAFKIAAVVIVVFSISYLIYNQTNTSTPDNSNWIVSQTDVYLPDSSWVALNADSQIRFTSDNWDEEREVELEGEAFFKVKKGSRFNVNTNLGTVTVLGTEFSVKDRNEYYEVICYSGLVQVVTQDESVTLEPKSAFRIVNNKKENYLVSNKIEPEWINGESSFRSVPFHYVIEELERQYNITVKTNDIDLNQYVSVTFSNQNLEIALESITNPVNLDYVIEENKNVVTLESK